MKPKSPIPTRGVTGNFGALDKKGGSWGAQRAGEQEVVLSGGRVLLETQKITTGTAAGAIMSQCPVTLKAPAAAAAAATILAPCTYWHHSGGPAKSAPGPGALFAHL